MGDMLGVKFINVDTEQEIHTLDDWGCYMHNRQKIAPPAIKWLTEDIPGGNGKLNYTKALSGRVNYNTRLIHIELFVKEPMKAWDAVYSKMLDALHGQHMHIIFDSDLNYYWDGWTYINELQSQKKMGIMVIEAEVDPYKYELHSSLEDWKWDELNFEDGIIRDYKNLTVNGALTLVIPGRRMEVVPTFIASNIGQNGLHLSYNGETYHLTAGDNIIPAVDLGEGDNTLVFSGSGTVSVDYRGGRL